MRWLRWATLVVVALGSGSAALDASDASDAADAVRRWARGVASSQLGADALEGLRASATINSRPPRRRDELAADWLLEAGGALDSRLDAAAALLARMAALARDELALGSFAYPCAASSSPNRRRSDLRLVRFVNAAKRARETRDLVVARQLFLAAADGAADDGCRAPRSGAGDARLRRLFRASFGPRRKRVALLADGDGRLRAIEDEVVALARPARVADPRRLGDALRDPPGVEFDETLVLYLGSDRRTIAEIVEQLRRENRSDVVFNTCDARVDSAEEPPLSDLPRCDPTKIGSGPCRGADVRFDSSHTVGQIATLALIGLHASPEESAPTVDVPVWDASRRDLLVPMAAPCSPHGVAVVELYLADLAREVVYFVPPVARSRAFLVDLDGNVAFHSTYSRPEAMRTGPKRVDVSQMETAEKFATVRSSLLAEAVGKRTIEDGAVNVTYAWSRIRNLYVLCVAFEFDADDNALVNVSRQVTGRTIDDLQYHRIDLLPPPNGALCRHFKRVATVERGTLYLSPSSFRSPFKYLHDSKSGKDISLKVLQSYVAYLKDNTKLLSNPGLRQEIRNDVGLLYPMLGYYKRQHIYGPYNKYIVRRYAATDNGVLVMFPGSILESDYEPNRKAWFKRAIRNRGKIVISPPYLDVGGAGYVVTLSFAPKDSLENLKPGIVVSIDITMGFLYKILEDSSPFCKLPNVHCFLMDDRGYLLSHPSLFARSETGPIEQQHITHKESFVANDMLNHPDFVQKKLCKKFEDGTLQRYYSFNLSISSALTNLGRGEHCKRYYIAPIEDTNAFLGIVNSSCEEGAFCPCSVIDRLCLNCERMEQNECECPCECATFDDASLPSAPICEMAPERNAKSRHEPFYDLASHLGSCFDFRCDSYSSESGCSGVMGCEWCSSQSDAEGESPLAAPFCSTQAACFGGVLGAVTPYGEGSLGHVVQDDALASYSAVGPIAGCAVAVCLILAVAVYCYKQNAGDAYAAGPDAWPEGVQMSRLPSEEEEAPPRDERAGDRPDESYDLMAAAVPISPYRVVTGCRRPNTTGESDHGYSTMTPHDDSEHMAFALVEPFVAAVDKGGDAAEWPRSPSARGKCDGETVVVPCGRNSVLASVTVHRDMGAT